MALTIDVYFNIADAKGEVSTITIPIPAATTLPNALAFTRAMGELIKPCVNGTLRDMGFSVSASPIAPWNAAASISDVQEKAAFAFRTANNFLKKLHLPTFLETKFTPNSKQVNTADPSIAAFVSAMESGIDIGGGVMVSPCDIRAEDVATLESAVEAWGRSRG